MASGKRNARLEKSLFKQEEGIEVDEKDDDLSDDEGVESKWSREETVALMGLIKKQLKERDTFSYIRRIQLLDWAQVKIEGKSITECKLRLRHLVKKIRHVRTLGEILSDVDIETIDVRKPKSAYALFCEEMKNSGLNLNGNNFFREASERFKNLTVKERAAFEKESRRQSVLYKQQCPKGTRRKKSSLTPLALFSKHHEKKGMTDKDKLKRQFAALPDSEKLQWIQKAINANEDEDIDKILSKDEQSLFKGEPKQPLNAFNLFIKKLSAEGKIDFKTATEAYRSLSKDEKDVYIEMSRKAKIQYKHDLATYLFSLPPEEQTKYLNKIEAPKRTRAKRQVTIKTDTIDAEIDDDLDEENGTRDSIDFEHPSPPSGPLHYAEESATPSGAIVYTIIKTESSFGEPSSNSTILNEFPSQSIVETTKADASKTKLPIKQSKALDKVSNIEEDAIPSNKENSNSKVRSKDVEPEKQTSRKSNLTKSSIDTIDDDNETSTLNSSGSEKRKEKKRRKLEEDQEPITDFQNKRIKSEEPERVPSRPYYYYAQQVHSGKRKKAKKSYIKLDHAEKKRIRKDHKRLHKEYLVKLQEYCESMTKKEMENFAERMRRAEELELETSDPDED